MSSPLEQAIAALVTRLETITNRLEGVEKQLASGASVGSPAAASSSSGASDASSSAAVRDYDDLIATYIKPLAAVTQKIGSDELKAQIALIEKLADAQRNFIATAAASKKPDAGTIEKLLAPSVGIIGEITALRDKNRTSKQFNHLSAISEGVPAFGWVVVSPTPGPYVNEARASSEFYSNKILVEFKKKDETQVDWVSNWNNFLKELATYIKKHHTTELSWNPRGGDASSAAPSAAPAAPKPPSAPLPPPAGAPPTSGGAAKPDANALFAALNKGDAITSGLKKVEKSQMTHKNPELRANSVVPAEIAPKKAPAPSAKVAAKKGTPKFELQGNKWVVEFQDGNKNIEINQTEPKQAVYIYKSDNSVIKINGKVNSIAIDGCNKTGIVFQDAISSVEAVNSNSIEIQVLKNVPSVTIDKCSGVQIYLSKDSLHTEVVTSKSDQMNVLIPGAKEGDDLIELPVPEQYKTLVKGNRLVTETMEHV